MQAIYDEYGIDLSAVLSDAGDTLLEGMGLFTEFIRTALQSDSPADAIKELSDAIKNGIVSDLNDVSEILKALNGDYASISSETAKLWAITKMQANSVAWHSATDTEKERLANENLILGSSMGLTRKSDGYWYDQGGNKAYSFTLPESGGSAAPAQGSTTTGGGSTSGGAIQTVEYWQGKYNEARQAYMNGTMSGASAAAAMEEANKNANYLRGLGYIVTALEDINKVRNGLPVYDGGGILHGVGGIKATGEDEMILPPDMTKSLVKAEAGGTFERVMRSLGIVTSAANAINLTPRPSNINRYGIGTQNNSSDIIINGLELKNVSGGTTINELAQLARGLA